MATYKDIQQATGLSLATISKYFNGASVRPENATAIAGAAEALGFRRNAFAHSLRTRRSGVIGVVVPELDAPFHMSIVARVEQQLGSDGLTIMVRAGHADVHAAASALLDQMVDGLIIVPTADTTPAQVNQWADRIPVVLLDRDVADTRADRVLLDNVRAAREATECLLAFGHRDVVAIAGPQTTWTMSERAIGFSAALRAAGIAPESHVIPTSDLSVGAGHEAMARLLGRRPRPTGVVCFNHDLTVGALTALTNVGLSMPDELSFVGFDAIDFAMVTSPRPWVVTQPIAEFASHAARLMRDRLSGFDGDPVRVVTRATLVPGNSVAQVPGQPERFQTSQEVAL